VVELQIIEISLQMKKNLGLLIFLLVILAVLPTASFVFAQYYTGLCVPHNSQQCSGSYLYWYNSCGSQEDLIQYCSNGCSNGYCNNSNNNFNNNYFCNSNAYRECVGNIIYWYDSCSNRQDLYQNCSDYNLVCQYGQCVANITPVVNDYSAHYKKACYNKSIYWYDSLGVVNSLYQNCEDSNNCTIDSCVNGKCSNVLKCDGSVCPIESEDYSKYCASINCGNGMCEQALGENENNCQADCKINLDNQTTNLSISFFIKKDLASQQWDKSVQLGQNGTVYFMVILNNNSESQVDNIVVSANIPNEIYYLGNLKIDDVLISGDIVAGVDVGSIQAMGKKSITFEGKTQTFTIHEQKKSVASINSIEPHQSDSISINFDANQDVSASISSTPMSETIMVFLKRWYMWIIAGLVLVFLFFIVFKRISSNV